MKEQSVLIHMVNYASQVNTLSGMGHYIIITIADMEIIQQHKKLLRYIKWNKQDTILLTCYG